MEGVWPGRAWDGEGGGQCAGQPLVVACTVRIGVWCVCVCVWVWVCVCGCVCVFVSKKLAMSVRRHTKVLADGEG